MLPANAFVGSPTRFRSFEAGYLYRCQAPGCTYEGQNASPRTQYCPAHRADNRRRLARESARRKRKERREQQ